MKKVYAELTDAIALFYGEGCMVNYSKSVKQRGWKHPVHLHQCVTEV